MLVEYSYDYFNEVYQKLLCKFTEANTLAIMSKAEFSGDFAVISSSVEKLSYFYKMVNLDVFLALLENPNIKIKI